METLLVAAIIVTTVAVVAQAAALIAMYVMSRRVMKNVDGLVNESQKLIVPLKRVTGNLETVSQDLVAMGKDARQEMHHVQTIVSDTQTAVREQIQDLRGRVNNTVDHVENRVKAPFREWSAVTRGISAGIRTFFRGRSAKETLTCENNAIRPGVRDFPAA